MELRAMPTIKIMQSANDTAILEASGVIAPMTCICLAIF
jgi:hypothetical protein